MFTVYILFRAKSPKTYVGYTDNLKDRIKYHNGGKVKAIKLFRPWRIIYTELLKSKAEAKQREQYWKSGAGRRSIKKIISGSRPTFRKLGEARSK